MKPRVRRAKHATHNRPRRNWIVRYGALELIYTRWSFAMHAANHVAKGYAAPMLGLVSAQRVTHVR